MMMPADFSAEEQELARALNSLFPLEQEQLPPRFVQTLATENGAWAAPSGLEQRAASQVFRRLRLPRRLFSLQAPEADDTARGPRWLGRAPRALALSTLRAVVVLSLVEAPAPTASLDNVRWTLTSLEDNGQVYAVVPMWPVTLIFHVQGRTITGTSTLGQR